MVNSSSPVRKQSYGAEAAPASPYRVGNWTVTKLKEELKQRNMPANGRKLDLIERLEEADRTPLVNNNNNNNTNKSNNSLSAVKSVVSESSEVDDATVEKVLAKMTVAQLQEELMRRGLSPVGKKNELVARLALDDVTFPATSSSPRGRTRSPVRSSPTSKKLGSPSPTKRTASPTKSSASPAKRSASQTKQSASPTKRVFAANDDGELKFWSKPVETFTHLGLAFAEMVNCGVACLKKEPMKIVSVLALSILLVLVDRLEGAHQKAWKLFSEVSFWLLGWFLNGLISSVSLGVNGNGFPMFLGPFMAKLTTTAFYCRSTDFPLFGRDAFKCGAGKFPPATFVNICVKAVWPVFAYGLGVVLGQFPLYLLACCTGSALVAAKKQRPLAFKGLEALEFRSKYLLLLFSSMLPNPFFDIARVYFGLRGWFSLEDFFFATLLGKFFVKTVGEALFVVLMFSTAHLQRITGFLRNVLGVPQNVVRYLMAWISIQRGLLEPSVEPLQFDSLVWAWQGVLLLTAVLLLISLINATATAHKLKKSN